MGALTGKVALISGVARGQGRSHATRLAAEGACIVGFDLCEQIGSVAYAMASKEDLLETEELVRGLGGEIVVTEADVRSPEAVADVVARGLEAFGRLDIVLANAGIMPSLGSEAHGYQAWRDAVDVLLTGVYITIAEAIPAIQAGGRGGSIVITSSTAGLRGLTNGSDGSLGYLSAKHGVVGLMKGLANVYGPEGIRVNTVHPAGVNSPMVVNEQFSAYVRDHPDQAARLANVLPVGLIDPDDVSSAIVWLVSDAARYVTGVSLPVDAGFNVRT